MKAAHTNKQEYQKERQHRPSVQPRGMVELIEADLEQVHGTYASEVSGGPVSSSESNQTHSSISPR